MNKDICFFDGYIYDKNTILILASSETLEQEESNHCFLCLLKDGEWQIKYEDIEVIKACILSIEGELSLIMIGTTGDVIEGDKNGFNYKLIDTTEERPNWLRQLNDLKIIGQYIYAVGMKRQVFRRPINLSKWQRCDTGVLVTRESKEIAGFLSIDGLSESEVYAVGYGGQIWNFNGIAWQQIDSPTNLMLESILCIDNNYLIAAGAEGVILKGRHNLWNVIEQDSITETILDIETLNGLIYLSTEDGIYTLEENHVQKVDIGLDGDISTGKLHGNGKCILSIGENHVVLFDGEKWKEIIMPEIEI